MRIEWIATTDGGRVKQLVPENDADRAEIKRMLDTGEIFNADSFGDILGGEPADWPPFEDSPGPYIET